uniref:Uncharacterized protein n=1 Tax=Cannabis sativa TaxID=3483 RepID=A0A803PJ62_CANSA
MAQTKSNKKIEEDKSDAKVRVNLMAKLSIYRAWIANSEVDLSFLGARADEMRAYSEQTKKDENPCLWVVMFTSTINIASEPNANENKKSTAMTTYFVPPRLVGKDPIKSITLISNGQHHYHPTPEPFLLKAPSTNNFHVFISFPVVEASPKFIPSMKKSAKA